VEDYWGNSTGYTQKTGAVSSVNKKFISHLTRAQRTPSSSSNCPSFSCATSMLTAGLVSKMASQQEKAVCVLRFEVTRSVITVQPEFRARFRKDAPGRCKYKWHKEPVDSSDTFIHTYLLKRNLKLIKVVCWTYQSKICACSVWVIDESVLNRETENIEWIILSLKTKDQLDVTCYFDFTSYALNMFRTLIYPSSGAYDYSV